MSQEDSPSKVYPPRPPRVGVHALHRVLFNMTQPAQIQGMKLSNISITGVALLRAENVAWPAPGETVSGHLIVENRGFPTKIQVVHVSPQVVGGRFVDDPRLPMIQAAIRGFYAVEMAALSTMKVNPKYHKSEPDGEAHWIHGDNADLFYVASGNDIIRFRMNFLGNHFQAGKDHSLSVGRIIKEDESLEIMKGSALIEEAELTPELRELGLKFLANIPHLPAEHRKRLLAFISGK